MHARGWVGSQIYIHYVIYRWSFKFIVVVVQEIVGHISSVNKQFGVEIKYFKKFQNRKRHLVFPKRERAVCHFGRGRFSFDSRRPTSDGRLAKDSRSFRSTCHPAGDCGHGVWSISSRPSWTYCESAISRYIFKWSYIYRHLSRSFDCVVFLKIQRNLIFFLKVFIHKLSLLLCYPPLPTSWLS